MFKSIHHSFSISCSENVAVLWSANATASVQPIAMNTCSLHVDRKNTVVTQEIAVHQTTHRAYDIQQPRLFALDVCI